jgi:transcription antitermination factor NusG
MNDAFHAHPPAPPPWLVLRTRSRQENVVQDVLQQRQIHSFLPKQRDRARPVETALFPGYIFVQPRPEQVGALRTVRGSCGLLMSCGRHAQVVERDVEAIRIMVGSGAPLDVLGELVEGQTMEVIAGPFKHAQGQFVSGRRQQRLVINLHLIGRSLSVEIDAAHVRPLPRHGT